MIDDKLKIRLIGQLEGINIALQLLPSTPENVNVEAQLVGKMQNITEQLEELDEVDKRQMSFWGVYDGH